MRIITPRKISVQMKKLGVPDSFGEVEPYLS